MPPFVAVYLQRAGDGVAVDRAVAHVARAVLFILDDEDDPGGIFPIPNPFTCCIGWYHPEVDRTFADGLPFIRLPVIHVERVGNDPGAGLQSVEQERPQPQVYSAQQKHGDHGSLTEIGIEQVFLQKHRSVGDPSLSGVHIRLRNASGIQIHSVSDRAVPR